MIYIISLLLLFMKLINYEGKSIRRISVSYNTHDKSCMIISNINITSHLMCIF